jgi:DNA-binding PadR family transcriptional regulator
VSPGTLYPLLHDLEKAGWLKSKGKTVKGKRRRYYRVTREGSAQLEEALIALNDFPFAGQVAVVPQQPPVESCVVTPGELAV